MGNSKIPSDNVSETGSSVIYIEPEREAAAIEKFDTYLVPVSLLFIILSALDRNNVSRDLLFQESTTNSSQIGNARVFGFDKDLGLHGGQFGNIQTLSSLCSFLFELPWTLAVRRWGARKALGTVFVLWSCCTLETAFIHTYAQAIAIRMILCACEDGLSPGFAFL